jgi:hypothetical protein
MGNVEKEKEKEPSNQFVLIPSNLTELKKYPF